MLAGLLFATEAAEDRPDTLGATLPFAGTTLIEYQARLLIQAGATQIILVVARLTPELAGAVARIGRRGVTIDAVRSASEAAAKLHPLAHVTMLADGLVTTEAALAPVAGEGRDALLVIPAADAPAGLERVGRDTVWAGIARLTPARFTEVAAMPRDYDMQSALLRAAEEAGAAHLALPDDVALAGHGVERRGTTLETRGLALLASAGRTRQGWFDRFVVRPVARLTLPVIMRRGLGAIVPAGIAAALAFAGLVMVALDQRASGLLLALAGTTAAGAGVLLAQIRDEGGLARALDVVTAAVPALAALLLARSVDLMDGGGTAETIAVALVIAVALGERAAGPAGRTGWGGTPPGHLALLTVFAILGLPTFGLGVCALYAAATLAAAIERLRNA